MNELKEIKIRVEGPGQCKVVQDFLFENGCGWYAGGKRIMNLGSYALFVDSSLRVSCTIGPDELVVNHFRRHQFLYRSIK